MPVSLLLDAPFFEGSVASSAEVPSLYPVALNGRPYLVDLKSGEFRRESIPVLRPQADTSNLPGESSLNPEELWRRGQESWHAGAGQTYLDRPESNAARFRTSKGVDPWTRWALSLLPDTASKRASANTNLSLLSVGSYAYLTDGTALLYSTDLTATTPTWTTVTGTPGVTVSSMATNGFTVWLAVGGSGVYSTTRGAATAASYATGALGLGAILGYVKGRLMLGNANLLYNITASGALPAALFTHPNTDWTWVGFAEGPANIYAAGYSGDKSLIYRTAIKADGTGLDVPVVAGELPDGEVVRSIQGYLGYLLVGTDKGLRLLALDSAGNVEGSSSIIPTTSPVRCFEPQDRYVWYGLTNYDGTSTGLGRVDLGTFTTGITPAYASDLMATAQGDVTSVVTAGTIRAFTVSGVGVFAEVANRVASGTVDSGIVTYGLPDTKIAMYADVRHAPLAGTVRTSLAVNGGAFTELGANTTAGTTAITHPVGQQVGEFFELREQLERDAVLTTGPSLTRHTLRAYPAPNRGEVFTVPLILHERLDLDGRDRRIDPHEELDAIVAMVKGRQPVVYQEGPVAHSVFVEDYRWVPHAETEDGQWWGGTVTVRLKAVAE